MLGRQRSTARGTGSAESAEGGMPAPCVSVDGSGVYAHLIWRGVVEGLGRVPFHAGAEAPLTRRVLSGPSLHEDLERRIVVHELRDVGAEQRSYCAPHFHEFAEVNLLLSWSHLKYEIRLGHETYLIEAPASIHVPAGLVHAANVFEGSGFFIAMMDTAHYSASTTEPVPGKRE